MNSTAESSMSRSFVKIYHKQKVIYVKIAGTMDLSTNEKIAYECAQAVKTPGPWTGIADLCETQGFNSKGTSVWQTVFSAITQNIGSVYLATPMTSARMVTQAWGFFVKKKIHTFDTMSELVAKARHDLHLPEDILLLRQLPMRTRATTR